MKSQISSAGQEMPQTCDDSIFADAVTGLIIANTTPHSAPLLAIKDCDEWICSLVTWL